MNGSLKSRPSYVLPNQYVAPIVFEENFSLYDEQNSGVESSSVEYPQITWISDNKYNLDSIKRWSINNLVQFETCKHVSQAHTIDHPSLLVKVECRKAGCRCVLKNEPALAMKIVPGVNLIQGNTVQSNQILPNNGCSSVHEDFPNKHAKVSNGGWFDMRSNSQMSISSNLSERYSSSTLGQEQQQATDSSSLSAFVITSCCPAWFELVKRTPNSPVDYGPLVGGPLPVWTSGKALWKAKAGLILVRKNVKYYTSFSNSFLETIPNINVGQLHSQQVIAINSENISTLKTGTVLIVLALKVCQFMTICSSSTGSLRAKGKSKSVNMLQCGIVGYKSLSKIPGYCEKLLPKELPFIYLPLDDNTSAFSPVAIPSLLRGQIRMSNGIDPWSNGGVHSILSLLSLYRMPIYVKPIFGKNLSEWLNNPLTPSPEEIQKKSCKLKKSDPQSLIKFSSCYYGTLIFLEPLLAPENSRQNVDYQNPSQQSKFFVVTSKMLNNHTFLVADSQSRKNYNYNLKMHAHRVAQFLSACHPVYGLNYLFKYLENNSNSCNVGPPNEALTKTLGPPIYYPSTLSSVYSIAAMTSIQNGSLDIESDENDFSRKSSEGSNISSGIGSLAGVNSSSDSGSNTEILNEIEEIYLYVRTGRLPDKKAYKKFHTQTVANQKKIFVVQNPMPDMCQELFITNQQQAHSRQQSVESRVPQQLPEMFSQIVLSDNNIFKNFPFSKENSQSTQRLSESTANFNRSVSHLNQPKSPLVRFSYKNASFSQPSNSPQIRSQSHHQRSFLYGPCSASSTQDVQAFMTVHQPAPHQPHHAFNLYESQQKQPTLVVENPSLLLSPIRKTIQRSNINNIQNSSMNSSLCSLPETSHNDDLSSQAKNLNSLCVINEFGEMQPAVNTYQMATSSIQNSIANNSMIWMKRSHQRLDYDEPKSCCLSNLSLVCNQNSTYHQQHQQMNMSTSSPLVQHQVLQVKMQNKLLGDRTNSSPDTGLGPESSAYYQQGQGILTQGYTTSHMPIIQPFTTNISENLTWTPQSNFIGNKSP